MTTVGETNVLVAILPKPLPVFWSIQSKASDPQDDKQDKEGTIIDEVINYIEKALSQLSASNNSTTNLKTLQRNHVDEEYSKGFVYESPHTMPIMMTGVVALEEQVSILAKTVEDLMKSL